MDNHINLIAFGTFGNPNGFTQTVITENQNLAKKIKNFDVRGEQITIYPTSTLYSIRKEQIAGNRFISYSKYSFAKEPTSTRGGSFIGSAIMFNNQIAKENITIEILNEFHQNLVDKNVKDDIITVNHSDNFITEIPTDFDKRNYNLEDINELDFAQTTKKIVVFCETSIDKLQYYFEKSIDLLNVYDTIYFTQNKEIAKRVKFNNNIPLIQNVGVVTEFELELQKLNEDRLNRKEVLRNELIQEKHKISSAKEKKQQEFEKNIEANKKAHQENESKIVEAENQLRKISLDYNQISEKISELIEKLNKGENIEVIKQNFTQLSQKFRTFDTDLRPKIHINSIQNQAINRNIPQPIFDNDHQMSHKSAKINNLGVYKISTFFLSIILIIILGWFLYSYLNEEKPIENVTNNTEIVEQIDTDTLKLNPLPNHKSSLKIKVDTKYKDIIDLIYKNDTVKKYYEYQKSDYSKHLFKQNEGKFTIEMQDTIFKDTVIFYPIYKN